MAPPCKTARTLPAAPPCHHQHLPDEVIEDIFARMPAKSVLRCRCLSRAWAAALSSDAFVDRHLDLANRRHREEAPSLCFLPGSAAASTVYAWSPEEHEGKAGAFVPLMDVPHSTRNGALMAVTRPCRGLLLLRAAAARLYYLCNPSVGEIAALPDGRMAGARRPTRDYASFGLGYDARARRHKVVRLLYHDYRPAACELYDVGASSVGHWRPPASGAVPPDRVRMNLWGVFAEGHVHWITMRLNGQGEAIVSFSITEEEFGYVSLPSGTAAAAALRDATLTELAGRLCLLLAPHSPMSPMKSIDIWLMTDYAARTWGTHWHIDLTKLPPAPEVGDGFMFHGVTPIALVDGGRRVVFVSGEYQVVAYCLVTGTLKELVPGLRRPGHHGGGATVQLLVPYEESLVSAGRPFEDILFSPPPARALSVALRRLPARTLGRLKLVCRRWRAMIESDQFAAWHNARARATATTCPNSVVFSDLLGSAVVPLESCSDVPGGAGRRKPPLSTRRVVCRKPCHGLLLLTSQHVDRHGLLNPVTRDVSAFSFHDGDHYGCAGLGYDQSREEHVLVRLCYTRRCFDTRSNTMECAVWRLRDLHPRTPASSPPPITVAVDLPPVHVGGKMYWPGEPPPGSATARAAILAFDISTEAFEVVPAPPVLLNFYGGDRMILTELAGELCAVHSPGNPARTMIIWGRNGGGWTRDHVIELEQWPEFWPAPTTGPVIPMAVDPVDGRILLDTGKAVGYYDTRSRTLETVYSLKSQIGELQKLAKLWGLAEDMFVIAAVCEDSLLRPYDRKHRIW
ncbi:hypothetical protein ACP70R_041331 [Stipagrostis hirtigluma subsp. patula]